MCAGGKDCNVKNRVLSITDAHMECRPGDIVVYYYGIFDPNYPAVAALSAKRKVFYYHNQTPPRFFAAHDPGTADALTRGLQQIHDADQYFTKFLANSPYTIDQQISRGALRKVAWEWLPPFVSPKWKPAAARHVSSRRYTCAFLGRIVPHKALDKAIHVFRAYQNFDPQARMVVVGSGEGAYFDECKRLMADTSRLDYFQSVTDGQRSKILRNSACLLNFSLHEGFSLPVIESLEAGCLPAYGKSVWLHSLLQSDTLRLGVDDDYEYAGYCLHKVLSGNPEQLHRDCVARVKKIAKMFHPDFQYRVLTT